MRNITILAMLALTFSSCYKDNSNDPTPLNTTWISTKTTYIEREYQGTSLVKSDTTVFVGQTGEFLAISSTGLGWRTIKKGSNVDGTVWYGTTFDTWNTIYVRTGNLLTIGDGSNKENYTIATLNNQQLILDHENTSTSGTHKFVTFGKFEFKK